jgi:hypothetical protein
MDHKEELTIDQIADQVAASKIQSAPAIGAIPGSPHSKGKAGLATQNPTGLAAEKARKEELVQAASEGRVIVNPKAGVDAVMQMINREFDEEFIRERFTDVLTADKVIVSKDGSITHAPDHGTRVRALELLLKYRVGLPVQRTEDVTPKTSDSSANLRAKLAASPALRRAFRETLDRLDAIDPEGSDPVDGEVDVVKAPMRRPVSRVASKYEGIAAGGL